MLVNHIHGIVILQDPVGIKYLTDDLDLLLRLFG